MGGSEVHEVSIGATDIINRITLKDIYREILSSRPDYRLDLGYVSRLLPVFAIKAKKLLTKNSKKYIHGLRSMCDFQFAQLDIDTPKRSIYLVGQEYYSRIH